MTGKRKNTTSKKALRKKRQKFIFLLSMMVTIFIIRTTVDVFAKVKEGFDPKDQVKIDGIYIDMIASKPLESVLNDEIERLTLEKKEKELERIREELRIEKEKKQEEERLKELERLKNQKTVYLTFDDGPSRIVTPQVLDILKKEDIKATFFILGKMARENPDILKRIYDEGHDIAHHSYSHNYKYIYANTSNFIGEIEKTNKLFKEILGDDFSTNIVRFPGGSFEKKKKPFIKAINDLGYVSYDWDALNGDAEGHNLPPSRLVNRLKSTVGNKKHAIVLMHDTDAKQTTVDSLEESIRYLKNQGYSFGKLSQLP